MLMRYNTLKILTFMAASALCLAACKTGAPEAADSTDGPRFGNGNGPRGGEGVMMESKKGDTVFTALRDATVGRFRQFTFEDKATGRTMQYNLFVPEGYDGSQRYPLVLFMADASTVGKGVEAPLTQGYGALEFASGRDQKAHPSFVLVPQYTEWTVTDGEVKSDEVEMTVRLLQDVMQRYRVDARRVYTTGQSMGGMMSMHFNIAHPDLFAASLFVSCQWDTALMHSFAHKRFCYVAADGDEKASAGQRELLQVLKKEGARVEAAGWNAKLPADRQDSLAAALLARGADINFVTFDAGTVLPESGKGMEHMASFDYGYRLTPLRDWLFRQSR